VVGRKARLAGKGWSSPSGADITTAVTAGFNGDVD